MCIQRDAFPRMPLLKSQLAFPHPIRFLRRVRRSQVWNASVDAADAGRAGTRIRSEALHGGYHRTSCRGSRGSASLPSHRHRLIRSSNPEASSLKHALYDRAADCNHGFATGSRRPATSHQPLFLSTQMARCRHDGSSPPRSQYRFAKSTEPFRCFHLFA